MLIRAIAAFADMTPAAMAREIGVAKTTINRPYSGKATARLSGPTLEKLKRRFPDFPGWTAEIDKRLPYRSPAGGEDSSADDRGELIQIPTLSMKASQQGSLNDASSSSREVQYFPKEFIGMLSDAAEADLLFAYGIGDTMVPTIGERDLLLIDKSCETIAVNDQIWALKSHGVAMVKRVRIEAKSFRLLSDNPAVPDCIIDESRLELIGRVVAIIKRL